MKAIHILLFLFLALCLPALAAAQAVTTLLVKTDMSCNWKLDGQPMDPLKADASAVVVVSPGEHLIEASTTDGTATDRTKVVVDHSEKTVEIQLQSKYNQQLRMKHADTVSERTGAALSPTWTDFSTALMWARKDNGSDVNWPQATAYCSKLTLGGYTDWRLPTADELQGIYDPSVSVQTNYDAGLYHVHVKGHLQLTGWAWSSTKVDVPGSPRQEVSTFAFNEQQPRNSQPFEQFSYSMRALCVRRSEK